MDRLLATKTANEILSELDTLAPRVCGARHEWDWREAGGGAPLCSGAQQDASLGCAHSANAHLLMGWAIDQLHTSGELTAKEARSLRNCNLWLVDLLSAVDLGAQDAASAWLNLERGVEIPAPYAKFFAPPSKDGLRLLEQELLAEHREIVRARTALRDFLRIAREQSSGPPDEERTKQYGELKRAFIAFAESAGLFPAWTTESRARFEEASRKLEVFGGQGLPAFAA